jgi:hypothetical protein
MQSSVNPPTTKPTNSLPNRLTNQPRIASDTSLGRSQEGQSNAGVSLSTLSKLAGLSKLSPQLMAFRGWYLPSVITW